MPVRDQLANCAGYRVALYELQQFENETKPMTDFLLAQLTAMLAGLVVLAALGAWRLPVGLWAPVAWLAGTATLAVEYLLLALAQVAWTPATLGLPWLALLVVAAWRVRAGLKHNERIELKLQLRNMRITPGALTDLVVVMLILGTTAVLFWTATNEPLAGWDAWQMWFMKGRAFYQAGGIPATLGQYGHPDYPLMVPLTIAYNYSWTGDHDSLVKGWWSLLVGTACAGVYFGLEGLVSRIARVGGLLMLLQIPHLINYGSGYDAGYADLPLAVFLLYGALFLYRWLKQQTATDFMLAALFFSFAAFTKNEGLVTGVAALLLLVGLSLALRQFKWSQAVILCLLAGLIIVPWQLKKSTLGFTSDLRPDLGLIQANWDQRIAPVVQAMAANIPFPAKSSWAWILMPALYLVSLIVSARRWLSTLPVLAIIVVHSVAAIIAYIVSPHDLNWHLSTSVARVMFQTTLIMMLLGTVYLGMLLDRYDPARSTLHTNLDTRKRAKRLLPAAHPNQIRA